MRWGVEEGTTERQVATPQGGTGRAWEGRTASMGPGSGLCVEPPLRGASLPWHDSGRTLPNLGALRSMGCGSWGEGTWGHWLWGAPWTPRRSSLGSRETSCGSPSRSIWWQG